MGLIMIGQMHFYLMMNTLCSSLQHSAEGQHCRTPSLSGAGAAFHELLSEKLNNNGPLTKLPDAAHNVSTLPDKTAAASLFSDSSSINALYTLVQPLGRTRCTGTTDHTRLSGLSNHLQPYTDFDTETVTKQKHIEDIIQKASRHYDIDTSLLRSVIRAESGFDPSATSSKGAMGLMQIMPETAEELGLQNPYDPEENIMAGTRYLRRLLDRYSGDVEKALAAYNWGMGNVDTHGGSYPRETRDYIRRINEYLTNSTVV